MSTIGPAGYAAQIASSVARTHRGDADAARNAEASQRQSVQAAAGGVEALDEAAKAELSTDRDPDGRRAWEFNAPNDDEATTDDSPPRANTSGAKITDTLDSIGGHLDIEA